MSRSIPRQINAPAQAADTAFAGFALPTSNTTYCPNQFFDVCLPHYSRGVVRLVSYMIRKTLGWSDKHGNPQNTSIRCTYSELQRHAGISRDQIAGALAEAVRGNFIGCIRRPSPNHAGKAAVQGVYELRWDEGPQYIKDSRQFRGFFAGEGNRTYIPNQFFDVVVPGETLAMIKVVGSIIRFSIGFQTKYGHRRQQVAMAYQDIRSYSHLSDRTTLASAIRTAIQKNYIQRVEAGLFDPNAGRQSKAAVYAIRWLNSATDPTDGQKTRPAINTSTQRSENPTGNGQKTRPEERSENQTDIQITETNDTSKQQDTTAVALKALGIAGFDARAAQAIATTYPAERILRQIDWLSQRRVSRNPLGFLRSAITKDWPRPGPGLGLPNLPSFRGSGVGRRDQLPPVSPGQGQGFVDALRQAEERLLNNHNLTRQ